MFSSHAYFRAFFIFILAIIPFTVARIALHQIYSSDFESLTFLQTVTAYIHGLRFDAAIVITYIGFPLIFMMLPFQWAKTQVWQLIWAWVIFFVLLVFAFTLTADIIYFAFVHRHTGPEIHFILSDIPMMLDIATSDHPFALITFGIIGLLAAALWHKSFKVPLADEHQSHKHNIAVFIIFLGLIIIGRGGLQHKPVRISNAFTNASAAAAYLTINGTFAITQSLRNGRPSSTQFMPNDQAIKITQDYLKADNETFVDKNYPLMRKVTHSAPSTSPNIVFLLIESLDSVHFDRQRKMKGLEPYGSTPNLDRLSKEGLLFTHFFSAGQKSIDGIAAIIAAVPTLPGLPYLGQGLEQNKLNFIGNIAKQQGYSTLFTRSASRGSFHVDSISSQAGFDQYYGSEDIPAVGPSLNSQGKWGVWDHFTFDFTRKEINKLKAPFLNFVFTSSTHTPWRIPEDKWKLHKGEDDNSKFLNSLYYADWAIGQFMEKVKKESYYDNTIFIITGDHVSGFQVDPQNLISRFRVPLIIIGPGIKPGIETKPGNHMDILPTLIDLAKWETTHSNIGSSLLKHKPERFSFSVNGALINYIDETDKFSLNPRLPLNKLKPEHMRYEDKFNRITAIQQTVFNALIANRLYKSTDNIKRPQPETVPVK